MRAANVVERAMQKADPSPFNNRVRDDNNLTQRTRANFVKPHSEATAGSRSAAKRAARQKQIPQRRTARFGMTTTPHSGPAQTSLNLILRRQRVRGARRSGRRGKSSSLRTAGFGMTLEWKEQRGDGSQT